MKNQVQLVTYTDRLAGSLTGLGELLDGPLSNLFGGIHLLPFFHPIDGADAGFDPIDHAQVDGRLGNWTDVAAITERAEVMADLIVNHISSLSPQFLEFASGGSNSEYDGMFLTFDGVFPEGATEQDLAAIYRPRPALPFTPMTLGDGSRRIFWTTFTSGQIDIDVRHARGIEYLDRILQIFADSGVSIVRLDAVGYAIKAAGTSCFMMPATFEFIEELTERARKLGLEVLVEIHSYYQRQIEIASRVDWVYDFALPPLILHAIFTGTAQALRRWIDIRPHNAVTVLDTHDGIGVIDIEGDSEDRDARPGLIRDEEIDALVNRIHENSRGESRRATGEAADNLDLYQVNCTFYDALGRDDVAYLLARAIQFFLPGVPQVYYVGLLAGSNDVDLLGRTNVGRDINRHHYSREEIDRELARSVVAKLLELIRLRNAHPAFGGKFEMNHAQGETLELRWRNGREFATLCVDLATLEHWLEVSAAGKVDRFTLDDIGQLTEAGRLPDCAATEAPR